MGGNFFKMPMSDPVITAYYERVAAIPSFKKTYGM
jgi:hypothetical protein